MPRPDRSSGGAVQERAIHLPITGWWGLAHSVGVAAEISTGLPASPGAPTRVESLCTSMWRVVLRCACAEARRAATVRPARSSSGHQPQADLRVGLEQPVSWFASWSGSGVGSVSSSVSSSSSSRAGCSGSGARPQRLGGPLPFAAEACCTSQQQPVVHQQLWFGAAHPLARRQGLCSHVGPLWLQQHRQQQHQHQQHQQRRTLFAARAVRKPNYQNHNQRKPPKVKLKTPSAAKRRFIVDAQGVLWRRQANRASKRYKKNRRQLRDLKAMVPVHSSLASKLRKMGFKRRWWFRVKA